MKRIDKIDKEILKKIDSEVSKAESYFLEGDFTSASFYYQNAIDIIPEPKNSWSESWSIYYGISELYFQNEKYEMALEYLRQCIQCPNGLGNPHVHLRIGQIRYELNQFEKAKDELMRAYMGGALIIFENEDEKYYKLIQDLI